MLLIPGIDLKGGKCVRLSRGQMDEATIYSDDPVATAARWIQAGARRLHIIDLDGAVTGKPGNAESILSIIAAYPDIPVQVGGGIRDAASIQFYLDAGADYVIIGTRAVTSPQFVADVCVKFPGRIIVGLDAKKGKLATDGWSKVSDYSAADRAKRLEEAGAAAIIFTDIDRDGMLNRVNIDATVALCAQVTIPVIASGGLRDLEDVRALCKVAQTGLDGMITGRAIYEGTLDLSEAQKLADELCLIK